MEELAYFKNPEEWEPIITAEFLNKLDHDWKNVFRLLKLPDHVINTCISNNKEQIEEQKHVCFQSLLNSRRVPIAWNEIRRALSFLDKNKFINNMETLIPKLGRPGPEVDLENLADHEPDLGYLTDPNPEDYLECLVMIVFSRQIGIYWKDVSGKLGLDDNRKTIIAANFSECQDQSYEALKEISQKKGRALTWSEIRCTIEDLELPINPIKISIIFGILTVFQGCPYKEMKSALEQGRINADVTALIRDNSQLSWHPDCYDMSGSNCGKCIIFSQESEICKTLPARKGSEHDKKRLEEVFSKLNFNVETYIDEPHERINSVLKDKASANPNDLSKCLVVCFLTHGINNLLYTSDGKTVDLHDVVTLFNGENCPPLRGKPKLFFVEACSGNEASKTYRIETSTTTIAQETSSYTRDAPGADHSGRKKTKVDSYLHGYADQSVYRASFPGTEAWLDPNGGSFFIQTLCEVFEKHATKVPFIQMVTKINNEVEAKSKDKFVPTMPSLALYSLRKDIYFQRK